MRIDIDTEIKDIDIEIFENKEEIYKKRLISVSRNWLLLFRPNERNNNHGVISVRFGT